MAKQTVCKKSGLFGRLFPSAPPDAPKEASAVSLKESKPRAISELVCPGCGATNPASANFCHSCGLGITCDLDDLFLDGVEATLSEGGVSVSLLQRKLKLSYNRAAEIVDLMEEQGIVGPFRGAVPREILISPAQWPRFPLVAKSTGAISPQRDYAGTPAYTLPADAELLKVDRMDGPAFERWCADLLKRSGFSDVLVTQTSGDQGADVIAIKDGIRYAIQCKCYSSDLGNKPVQEVTVGKAIYHCHVGAVMTNRYFTSGAQEAAVATGTLLWDRDHLRSMLIAAAADVE